MLKYSKKNESQTRYGAMEIDQFRGRLFDMIIFLISIGQLDQNIYFIWWNRFCSIFLMLSTIYTCALKKNLIDVITTMKVYCVTDDSIVHLSHN